MDKKTLEQAFDARFPLEMKDKLREAHVAIAGLGGLGSNIAVMLARSGVGHLRMIDFDVVDFTNLNRQAYCISHVGKNKTDALKEILMEINPYLDYEFINERVTTNNINQLFMGYSIVCEAFDKADQKAMLVQEILTHFNDIIVVSGNGMAGFGDSNEIQTRQKMRRLYVCGDGKTDIDDGMGLMSPRVTICAAHQANKVVQLILQCNCTV